jgi:hypothetical protein
VRSAALRNKPSEDGISVITFFDGRAGTTIEGPGALV